MIDLAKVDYQVILLPPSGGKINITDLIDAWTHEEMEDQISAKVTLSLKNVKREDGWMHQHVFLDKRLVLEATDGNGWREIFRGSVKVWKTNSENHTVHVVAYDPNFNITISKEHYYFKDGKTAAASIKEIASEQGIPIGIVDGPNKPLTKKLYKNSIANTMMERLKESERKGSGKYIIRSTKGKLSCLKEGNNSVIYELDDWTTESSSDERSIEKLITKVKIYGNSKGDARPKVEAVKTGKTEFGTTQEILYKSDFDNMKAANEAAAEILKEDGNPEINRPLIHPDIPWIRKGDKVRVNSGTINTMCIVKSVSRDMHSKKMMLQLKE
ncbi:XkdQ/YqbQ family protein [Sporosarcina sp. FSL W7-1283]|uniref:XkdQ/YqbQ family protein n=1 Tax=Sporosarcina sp. FSL W7-1283 TaxID=2921560 RepID=UPI0030FAE076